MLDPGTQYRYIFFSSNASPNALTAGEPVHSLPNVVRKTRVGLLKSTIGTLNGKFHGFILTLKAEVLQAVTGSKRNKRNNKQLSLGLFQGSLKANV